MITVVEGDLIPKKFPSYLEWVKIDTYLEPTTSFFRSRLSILLLAQ